MEIYIITLNCKKYIYICIEILILWSFFYPETKINEGKMKFSLSFAQNYVDK